MLFKSMFWKRILPEKKPTYSYLNQMGIIALKWFEREKYISFLRYRNPESVIQCPINAYQRISTYMWVKHFYSLVCISMACVYIA